MLEQEAFDGWAGMTRCPSLAARAFGRGGHPRTDLVVVHQVAARMIEVERSPLSEIENAIQAWNNDSYIVAWDMNDHCAQAKDHTKLSIFSLR